MFGTGSMLIIGRSFVRVSEVQNQREAEFRYALTRLRENGESIALLGGEKEERAGLTRNFSALLESWRLVMRQWMRTTFVSSTSGYFAAVLPILLCAPKYLAGDMTLGQVMQAASAFVIVQTAFALAGRQLSALRQLERQCAAHRVAGRFARRAAKRPRRPAASS